MTTVGVVSPGAMGSAIGRVLGDGGARVVVTVEGRSARTRHLAGGLEVLPTLADVTETSDIVLSIVPPGQAVGVAEEIGAAARSRSAAPLVADLNAIAPETMRGIAHGLEAAGLDAVDGSISGPPPRVPGTTIVYLSGAQAARIEGLVAPGLEFRLAGGMIGTASAIKMSTASFYKGQAALLAQALRAARVNGVLEPVLADMRRHYPDLVEGAPRALQNVAAKSSRYVAEMEEIAASQAAAGLPAELFAALALVYRELGRSELAALSPEQIDRNAALDDVLASLENLAGA